MHQILLIFLLTFSEESNYLLSSKRTISPRKEIARLYHVAQFDFYRTISFQIAQFSRIEQKVKIDLS